MRETKRYRENANTTARIISIYNIIRKETYIRQINADK